MNPLHGRRVSIMLLVALGCMTACARTADPRVPPDATVVDGVVHLSEIEGGCWAFHTDGGDVYQPVPEPFRQTGLAVRAAIRRADGAGFCPGVFVEVVWMRRR